MAPSFRIRKGLFNYSQDAGNMLLYTATAGWILSAAGQIFGIVKNEKVSKKEKKFLIPQEIADAAINIASFFLVTYSFQNFTKGLVSKGKIITPRIKEICGKYGIKLEKDAEGKAVNIGNAITKKISDYKAILDADKNEPIKMGLNLNKAKKDKINVGINELTNFKNEEFGPFESGLKIAGNVLGGVVSGNIITPMLRNPMAAYKQKTALERDQMQKDAELYRASQGENKPKTSYPRVILGSSSMKI